MHFLVRNVRVHGHFVTREIMVDEKAVPLVDGEFFHERGAHAHGHGADDLAARRLRIEDSSRGTHREHATHARLAGERVDAHLDEMRAETEEAVLVVEVAELDGVLGRRVRASRAACASGTERLPSRTWPSMNSAFAGSTPNFCATVSRSLTQAAYTPAVELFAPHCPPEPAANRETRSRRAARRPGRAVRPSSPPRSGPMMV